MSVDVSFSALAETTYRRRTLLIYPILAFAFAVRLYQLNSQSFSTDEFLSVWHTAVPLERVIRGIPLDHTPGYWVLLHFWLQLAGDSDATVRFLSVLWGVLSVAVIYALGNRLFTTSTGLVGAAFLAMNPFAIYYSQEARMYSQLLFFVGTGIYWFARGLERPQRKRYWVWQTLAVAGAIYTHYYAVALPLTQAAVLLIEKQHRTRTAVLGWFGSMLGVGLLFVPWLPSFMRMLVNREWQPPVDPLDYPGQLIATLVGGATVPAEATPLLLAVGSLAFVIGALATRQQWQGRLLMLSSVLPLAIILLALELKGNGPLARYFLVLLPAFVLLSSVAALQVWRWNLPLGLATFLMFLFVAIISLNNYWFDQHYSRPDWRSAAQYLSSQELAGDIILMDGAEPLGPFQRYYTGHTAAAQMPDLRGKTTAKAVDRAMTASIGLATRIWLILIGQEPGSGEAWLSSRGFVGDYEDFAGVYVSPVLLSPKLDSPRPPLSLSTSLDISVTSYSAGSARIGELLPVAISWKNGGRIADTDFQVSLRLIDQRGERVAALDRAPVSGFHPTREWRPNETVVDRYALPLPDTLATGTYSLQVLLYDPSTLAPGLEADLGTIRLESTAPVKR